eukprot:5931583-Prymnesium_polylepis.1
MPPPFTGCAPHLDHGLYHPQLMRWLQYFAPSQLLVVSFSGFVSEPAEVARDVLLHAGLPPADAAAAAARVKTDAQSAHRKKMEKCARHVAAPPCRRAPAKPLAARLLAVHGSGAHAQRGTALRPSGPFGSPDVLARVRVARAARALRGAAACRPSCGCSCTPSTRRLSSGSTVCCTSGRLP